MDNMTRRILAGEIVLTKSDDGFAVIAFTESLTGSLDGTLRDYPMHAMKADGTRVSVTPRSIIGRMTLEGRDVTKARVTLNRAKAAPSFCRCDGDTDNHGRCYQCGGYVPSDDAGRYL